MKCKTIKINVEIIFNSFEILVQRINRETVTTVIENKPLFQS